MSGCKTDEERELAIYRFATLQMWYELEERYRLFERTKDMVFALEREADGKKKIIIK